MNNKGFSLVELLAAIAILGILSTIAIISYTNYIEKTRRDGYDVLAKSAANAAEEYNMVNFGTTSVSITKLVEDEFLENAIDPGDNSKKCTGTVKIISKRNYDGIDTSSYVVTLTCTRYKYKYCFPEGTRIAKTATCPEE